MFREIANNVAKEASHSNIYYSSRISDIHDDILVKSNSTNGKPSSDIIEIELLEMCSLHLLTCITKESRKIDGTFIHLEQLLLLLDD